jgi:hypothetical protein
VTGITHGVKIEEDGKRSIKDDFSMTGTKYYPNAIKYEY